ncbi:Protein of unknown function [Terribacillus halophilus]|uniref:Uncharacterized protein n=1 Tax=Terribacillus halophilus TaxID=361279 RepID=A0A1G6PSW5_9BACI|nr:DUF4021 domain-containing protein [Terribacillus halophilus]SDC83312.1 Protein of unknown function [Terribacillus halophilus]
MQQKQNKSNQRDETAEAIGLDEDEQVMNGDYGHPETEFENNARKQNKTQL